MSASRALRPGEALPLTDLGAATVEGLLIRLSAAGSTPDLVALLVDATGKVRSDDDLVFYNNSASADNAVIWAAQSDGSQWMRVLPPSLDTGVARVVFGASGGLLDGSAAGLLTVAACALDGAVLASASFEAKAEYAAMILLEVYRRAGQWRLRLLAQGYAGGLAALVTEFGVSVDDPGDSAPMPPSPEPAMGQRTHPPSSPPSHTDPTAAVTPLASLPPPYPPPQAGPQWTPTRPEAAPRGLFTSRKRAQLEAQNAELNRLLATSGALDNAAIDAERLRLAGEVAALVAEADRRRADLAGLEQRLAQVRVAIGAAEGDIELAEVGLYHYRHRLDDSVAYKAQLDQLRDRIKAAVTAGRAVTGSTTWTVNGSAAQGRKMVREVSKLMLRAYNADADHAVRTLRPFKLASALTRLDTTRSTIARLGTTMSIAIADEYHRLRRAELELTADYLNKVEEEKERQRALREEQREQARADAEYAREQARLERDRDKYATALARLETGIGDPQQIAQVRSQLTSVNAAIEQVAYRRSNMRLGYVYVISNIGAFGERMVKIGMTRRIAPEDRVRELGDASVPFRFDTHALIFSEDAVALETALHQRFANQAVNQVNRRREFFYVTPAEVRQALTEFNSDILIEYNEETPAEEWRHSGGPDRALLPT